MYILSEKRKAELIAATLVWCNEKRAEQGKESLSELPLGKRGDARSCPCGAATGLSVGISQFWDFETNEFWDFETNDASTGGSLPGDVREFTIFFDNGLIPELDKERAA